jgi:FkbM family methyltransferase
MSMTYGFKSRLLLQISKVTRKLDLRGTNRLLNLIHHPDKCADNYLDMVVGYDTDLLIQINTNSYQEWMIFFRGYYEKEIVSLLKKILPSDGVAFEVGANIGSHALIMSRSVGSQGQVFAFEPYPKVFQKLVKNIHNNRINNIHVFPHALSNCRDRMNLFFSEDQFSTEEMNSSLYPDGRLTRQVEVEVKTLDEVFQEQGLERLDLIKIDTEGNEYKVLQGAQHTIKTHRPYVIFEYGESNWEKAGYSWSSVKDFFAEMDYSLYMIAQDHLVSTDLGCRDDTDILAVPN